MATFNGGSGNDTYVGGSTNDTINGNDGDDNLKGGNGNDTIDGGAGNDTVDGGSGNDTIDGGAGADTIQGGVGSDQISGGDGNDLIRDDFGIISVDAGAGDDMFFAPSTRNNGGPIQHLYGFLDGGSGTDTLVGASNESNISALTVVGWEKLISGGTLTATANQFSAFSDIANNGNSITLKIATSGPLHAAYTVDFSGKVVFANALNVTGNYQDTVIGHDGVDTITGAASEQGLGGNDILQDGGSMSGGDGDDLLVINLFGSRPQTQGAVFDGGAGEDTLSLVSQYNDPVGLNLSAIAITGVEALEFGNLIVTGTAEQFNGFTTISGVLKGAHSHGVENLILSDAGTVSFATQIVFGDQLNVFGSDGNDSITGHAGVDHLSGGKGDDILNGGGADDVIQGGSGDDVMDGGSGNNVVSYANAAHGVTVSLGVTTAQDTIGAGVDTLSNFSTVIGSGFNDTLDGGGTGTVSYADGRAVTVSLAIHTAQDTGAGGIDTLTNFAGLTGSVEGDILTGDDNANTISGGAGADDIDGGAGDDTLIGGAGGDSLTGGGGADRFVFTHWQDSRFSGTDTITDMTAADIIDLSAIDAMPKVAGDQAFTLVSAFTHHAGDAWLHATQDGGVLFLDINGDAVADGVIVITGDISHSADWIL